MESERKIEKWLRTCAKKRRSQAGDPFKLDSATRRILRNEISRNAPASDDDGQTISLWELLRRHWMFFLGFAACIFIMASFYVKSVETAHKRATSNRRVAAANAGEPGRPWTSNSAQIAARTESPPTAFSRNITEGLAMTNSAPLNPPTVALAENAPTAAVAAPPLPGPEAPGAPPEARATASLPVTTSPLPAGGYAMAPMHPSRLLEIPRANGEGKITAAPASGAPVQNMFMNVVTGQARPTPVLMNFRVVQAGNYIRVMDRDGSVYRGVLHPEQAPAVYSFRVTGMNRTLNQPVLFAATLIENLNSMKSARTNQTGQLPWSSLRIVGMAVVDRTNQIQINAEPVMPMENRMPPH